jgi:hypothetical protein
VCTWDSTPPELIASRKFPELDKLSNVTRFDYSSSSQPTPHFEEMEELINHFIAI